MKTFLTKTIFFLILICLCFGEMAVASSGDGQIWQAPVRRENTAYQNTTGQAIEVCITVVNGTAEPGHFVFFRVGQTPTGPWTTVVWYGTGSLVGNQHTFSATIPDGQWYFLSLTSPNWIKGYWAELR